MIGGLGEVCLDDFLKLIQPRLLQVVASLGDARCLDLLELVNFHRFGDIWVEDVLLGYIIALLSDLLLGTDDFVFNLKGSETELAELFREVVRRDLNHAEVRGLLGLRDRW